MQYIIRGDSVEYLTNALGPVLDFINEFAITISEKFTGGETGAALIMVVFYLIVLILILLLLKGIVSVVRDIFRTIFCMPKKKKARVLPSDNSVTNSDNEGTQTTIDSVEDVNTKKRTKNGDDLSLIKGFGNKKHIDDLSLTLDKINKFDNCVVQSQHIANTIPSLPITSEDNIVLSEKEKETILKQVKDKNLNELKDLLKQTKKEDLKFDNAIKSLDKDLSKAIKERDKLVQQELTAIEQHNNAVDALTTLCDELTKSKSDLLKKHSDLFDFITNLGAKKAVLLDSIKEFKKEISSVPEKIKNLASLCDKEFKTFVRSFQQKEELLAGFKKNYTVLSESRNKIDEDISAIQQKQSKAATDKAFHNELVTTLTAKVNELEGLEKERLAKEEAERLEKERLAKEEAEKLERERQEKLEAERLEKERLAKEEAKRLEQERLAKLEAERIEREKEETQKKQELETNDIAIEPQNELSDTSKFVPTSLDSADGLNEIKEQIKRQQKNSYSINYDDISPEMLEQMALAEKKKRMAAEKSAKLNGKSTNTSERSPSESNVSEMKDKESNGGCDKPAKEEDTATIQKAITSQEEAAPQTDYFAKLKQQWAEEEAHQQRWAEEKARREEEHQRRKKELAEKLSGNGFSNNNE